MKPLGSWNRIPNITPEKTLILPTHCIPNENTAPRPLIAHGNGRSYGDVCLNNRGTILSTRSLDRFIQFDQKSGLIRCDSGVTLQEILRLVVPRGWFLQVTPGTQFATIGGCVANDVHGKNHHDAGTFGHHVNAFELLRSNGDRLLCSKNENTDYFAATIGGLGLTGLISWVEIQLKSASSPFMIVETKKFQNLTQFWEMNAEAEANYPYTVSWIDCLSTGQSQGRGVLFAGTHADATVDEPPHKGRQLPFPVESPISLVNNLSLKAFNAVYYGRPLKKEPVVQHYAPFFYPLDSINNWNRMYGKKGFYQYQCVIPHLASKEAIAALLSEISKSGQGSFLAVLKTFGTIPSIGMLSFSRAGTTLALDFPNRGPKTLNLFSKLDAIVTAHGGALYPGKDARMSTALFQQSFPQWSSFVQYIDPEFSSHFWQRVTS